MNVIVIPFFLAAHLTVDEPWEHGSEYRFQIQVNSTAILPEDIIYGSMRLNMESKLICQPKGGTTLSCHFENSTASSYVADSMDPTDPAVPSGRVNRQLAYEINEDQFEIKFNERGLDSLVVNENIQPRELDMIRMIVGQLSVGTTFDGSLGNDVTFNAMENFTQGECLTTFRIDKKLAVRSLYARRNGYALKPSFGLKDGKLVQIRKIRNLHMCTHKVPYFFGGTEGLEESDIISDISLSDGEIIISSTEFISGMSNVITTTKVTEAVTTTLYENVLLRLESIKRAESEPPIVKEAESVGIFIGRWLFHDSFEEDN